MHSDFLLGTLAVLPTTVIHSGSHGHTPEVRGRGRAPEERGRRVGTFSQVTVFLLGPKDWLVSLSATTARYCSKVFLPSPASLILWRNHTAPPRILMMQETFYTALSPCVSTNGRQRAWKVPPRPSPTPSLSPDFLSSFTCPITATCTAMIKQNPFTFQTSKALKQLIKGGPDT